MSKNEIIDILPTPGEDFVKLKENNPYNILLRYANAIKEKYNNKLSAKITETNTQGKTNYTFYIRADIGRGYFYQLFDVIFDRKSPYPIVINIFDDNSTINDFLDGSSKLTKEVQTPEELNEELLAIFKSNSTSKTLLNLLAQVELAAERKEKELEELKY